MNFNWFNIVYVVVLLGLALVTAEIFRRKQTTSIHSMFTLIFYFTVAALVPVAFLFGFAAGGSIGDGLSALLEATFDLQNPRFIQGGIVVGTFIGAYLVILAGVLLGSFLGRLAVRIRSRL